MPSTPVAAGGLAGRRPVRGRDPDRLTGLRGRALAALAVTVLDAGGEVLGTVADDERLYVPVDRDGDWTVEAVELADGTSAWSRRLPWDATVTMVAPGGRLVFADVPDVDGRPGALGLDLASGEAGWRFASDDGLIPWRAATTSETLVLLARPARNEGAYRLAAVDLDSVRIRWRTDIDLQLPYAVDGERIVGTRVANRLPAPGLVAHDLENGSEAWRVDPGAGVSAGIAVPSGLLAVLATPDGPPVAWLA